jgi:hypothetical protein
VLVLVVGRKSGSGRSFCVQHTRPASALTRAQMSQDATLARHMW